MLKRLLRPFFAAADARAELEIVRRDLANARLEIIRLNDSDEARAARATALECALKIAHGQIAKRDAKIRSLTIRGQDTALWLSQVIDEAKSARRTDAAIIKFPSGNDTVN